MNNLDFMGRGQPPFRQQMRNFDEFSGVGFPHPNGDMVFNPAPLNQVNPNNAFFVPYDMVINPMMRAPNGAAPFQPARPTGFPGNIPAGMMPPTANQANGMVGQPPPVNQATTPGIAPHQQAITPMTGGGNNMTMQQTSPGAGDSQDDILLIFSKHCGRIIGKGGARIREIQDNSGARVKIHSDEEPVNGQTRVTVSGSTNERMLGKQLIQEVVTEGQRRYGLPGNTIVDDGLRSDQSWMRDNSLPPHQQQQQPHMMSNYQQQNANNNGIPPNMGSGGGARMGTWQHDGMNHHNNNMHNAHNGGGMVNKHSGGMRTGGKGDYEEELSMKFSRMMESNKKTIDHEQHPVVKNFYVEDPTVSAMTLAQREQFCRERQNIILPEPLSGNGPDHVPNPVTTFEQMWSRHPEILSQIKRQGFTQPTPIQCMAWPILLKGLDFIGIAQTGTGKTLAFLLPAMIHIEGQTKPRNQRRGPTALILSPTRELAMQIQSEADRYRYRGIRCVCLYGGAERRAQLRKLEDGCDMVVATPGRLNDLINSQRISLADVSYLVLDEADRMLDMGFEPQVVKALVEVRSDRQTVMTSATWPSGVRRIANAYMDNPLMVHVGTLDLNVCHDVTQRVEILNEEDKQDRLLHFITNELAPNEKVLIFVSRKADCSLLAQAIQCIEGGPNATCIHGDLDQSSREYALDQMRHGHVTILVATDLASRGLDIKDIAYVINYDFPKNIEEYVHRVGRTGRAGRTGTSITLMTRTDFRHADQLISIMEEAGQEVSQELRGMANSRFSGNNRGQKGNNRGGSGNNNNNSNNNNNINRGHMRGGGNNFNVPNGNRRGMGNSGGGWMPPGGGPRPFNHHQGGGFHGGFYGGGPGGPNMIMPGPQGEFGGMFDARMYGGAGGMYDGGW